MGLEEDISNIRADIEELKGLMEQSKRPRVLDFLVIETRRLETKLGELLKKQDEEKASNGGNVISAAPAQHQPKVYDYQVKNYSWDQSDKYVKIYLTDLKNVQSLTDLKSDFVFEPKTTSIQFTAKNLNGRNCIFAIKELAKKINPESSEFKVKTDMVVLMLKKYETEKWNYLKASDKSTDKPRFKPPSEDKDADPSASLMNMMKQMYEEGDDEMKKTIAKAWTESRGASSEL